MIYTNYHALRAKVCPNQMPTIFNSETLPSVRILVGISAYSSSGKNGVWQHFLGDYANERLLSFGFVTVAETLLGGREGEREGGKCANIGIFPFYRPNGEKPPIFQFPPWNTRNATGIRVYREGPFEMWIFVKSCKRKELSLQLFKLKNIHQCFEHLNDNKFASLHLVATTNYGNFVHLSLTWK